MVTVRPLIDFKKFDTPDWMRWVVAQHWGDAKAFGRKQYRRECVHGCPPSRGNRILAIDFRVGKFMCHGCGCAGNALTLWAFLMQLPVWYAAVDMCRKRQLPIPFSEPGVIRGDSLRS